MGAWIFAAPDALRDEDLLQRIVEATRFGAMKRRHETTHGEELRHAGAAPHFRCGVSGGWREQLSAPQRARFAELLRERLAGSGELARSFAADTDET